MLDLEACCDPISTLKTYHWFLSPWQSFSCYATTTASHIVFRFARRHLAGVKWQNPFFPPQLWNSGLRTKIKIEKTSSTRARRKTGTKNYILPLSVRAPLE